MSGEKRLVAEIDGGLKELVKSDQRTIKEIVESALEREFQTTENAAIRRRIDEHKQRVTTLKREINDRQAELSNHQDEIQRLESLLKRTQSAKDAKMEKAKEALEGTPRETDNPAIQNWADELGMTPEQLITEIDTQ